MRSREGVTTHIQHGLPSRLHARSATAYKHHEVTPPLSAARLPYLRAFLLEASEAHEMGCQKVTRRCCVLSQIGYSRTHVDPFDPERGAAFYISKGMPSGQAEWDLDRRLGALITSA